jgi:hypothetical protein
MKVTNIHKRDIKQPKAKIEALFKTLSCENDMMLATHKWPPMILEKGLQVGSKGGHGSIKYFVKAYQSDAFIQFEFTKPQGFKGFHKFEITEIDPNLTELKHTIVMNTEGMATLKWALAIRWLHNAYIEDALDKVENHFTNENKITEWSLWVRFLRKILKPKRKQE